MSYSFPLHALLFSSSFSSRWEWWCALWRSTSAPTWTTSSPSSEWVTVNTPPPLNPQSLNTDHSAPLIFLWSQANSCEFFNCAQLCLPPSSLGVMCSGPLDKVFSHVTLQYTSFIVWYLTNKIKEAVVLGECENPVFSMWIIFFLLISLLFVLKDTFSQRYSSDLLFQSHLIHS